MNYPPKCPKRCGPGGEHGPRCRMSAGHEGDCRPTGGAKPLRSLMRFRQTYLGTVGGRA